MLTESDGPTRERARWRMTRQGEAMSTPEYWGTILLDGDGQPRVHVASHRGPLRGRNLGIGPFWSPSEAEYATTFIWNVATRLINGRWRWSLKGWARVRQRYGNLLHDWEGLMPAEMMAPPETDEDQPS